MTAVQPISLNNILNGYKRTEKGSNESHIRYAVASQTGLEGPDQVLMTDVDITTEANGRIRIQLDEGINATLPISIPTFLSSTAKKYPDQIAMVSQPGLDGTNTTYTYKQYETEVRIVAKAFLKLGLERYHSVCILGFNSPQWFISYIATIYAGGFATGIYTTNSAEACQHCAQYSKANIIVVDDSKQLEKILQIRKNLPHLTTIVQYEGIPEEKDVLSWHELLEIGKQESDDKLESILRTIGVNECCTLIYTSGTVGNPKAVMLNHDNLIHNTRCVKKFIDLKETRETLVSYLPLSHIAAQIIDIFVAISVAGTVYFADKNALKGSLVQTLVAVKPTVIMSVPRVWEKIYEKMQLVARNNSRVKTWIANWAKAQGLLYNTNKMNGVDYKHWGYIIAKWLVFDKVKTVLGLDKCKLFVNGAAPLNIEIKKYFLSLDIPIMEGFGMSESSGPHTVTLYNNYKLGSVGTTLPGLRTKLEKPNETGEGEICLFGRHIFMGYLNEPEKTKETKDEKGWLHSGDLGKLDANGLLYITGRIKELIITAGGENIPFLHIEELILSELPVLSNVMLIGDRRKYLTVLVTLKAEVKADTNEPLDELTSDTLTWLKSIGSNAKTVSEIVTSKDPLVHKEIEEAIKRANTKAISNAQKVQKFRILPHDFSMPTGELGPTLKLKRNFVNNMYAHLIEEMYQ